MYANIMKKKKISVLIVSKNRDYELNRLLFSLNKSANFANIFIDVYLGIENNCYEDLKKFNFLKLKKIFFNKNTSPVVIKNYLYNMDVSPIKIFLDDDTEVKKDFIKIIKTHYNKNRCCFLRLNPVAYFTNRKKKITITNSIEFVGFVELGSKKFEKLIKLNFVAEDTELCNRINSKKIKIYQDSRLQIIHHISKMNRSFDKINFSGISNSIEILRTHGAITNYKIFIDLIFSTLLSVIFFKRFIYLQIILKKIFTINLNINFFNKNDIILPPYKNYFLNNVLRKKKLIKIKNINLSKNFKILRLCAFEKYQKIESIIQNGTYIGPKDDRIKIKESFFFSQQNMTRDSFQNLSLYAENIKKIDNLIIAVDDQIFFYDQLFLQLGNKYLRNSLKKVENCFIFINSKFYFFNKHDFFLFISFFYLISFPVKIFSYIIYIILIFPLKKKERLDYN